MDMDLVRNVLRVVPAPSGEAPQWSGRAELYGRRVCEQILDLLKSDRVPEGLDETGEIWLSHARKILAEVPVSAVVRPVVREERESVWHTFAGTSINAVLARLLTHLSGIPTSTSNLSVKIRAAGPRARDAALRVQEALVDGALPPVEEWGEFDTAKRSAILSAFQECLPSEVEQVFLRDMLLDIDGAHAWSKQVEIGE
jgi:hypothetical protein